MLPSREALPGALGDGAGETVPLESGALFVVATPIGNMGDITLRAVDTLRACSRVVAEDTRRTRALLSHLGIGGKPLDALHAHSSARAVERVVARLQEGETIALVTDAGTPSISDPGEALAQAAIHAGARVVPIPGASAVTAALMASGLGGDGRFRFVGFLPRDGSARRDAIALVCETSETVVLFEAPNRTGATLRDLADATPRRSACVARELTKLHEELTRGALGELAGLDREWLGEVAIVLGPHHPEQRQADVDDAALDRRIEAELAKGLHAKAIAERLAAWSGRKKRLVYERILVKKR